MTTTSKNIHRDNPDIDECFLPGEEAAQRSLRARFPFGHPLEIVEQTDRRPKRVFILGVYSSAIHARWVGPDGRTRVNALAIASEPYIFWRGERADTQKAIDALVIPPALGRLEPAADKFNGPSGRAIDERFLAPLGLSREDAWLCDMHSASCCNTSQQGAIDREYEPLREKYGLPMASIPPVPKDFLVCDRVEGILQEIQESQAELLVLLGDLPIKHFLRRVSDSKARRLADFGDTPETYGRRHKVNLSGRSMEVLPLVHPRQAASLGKASEKWAALHAGWVERGGALG